MKITPELQTALLADAARIRDLWDAGDRSNAMALLRTAHPYTVQWLQMTASTTPELKLAIQQEQLQRTIDAEG